MIIEQDTNHPRTPFPILQCIMVYAVSFFLFLFFFEKKSVFLGQQEVAEHRLYKCTGSLPLFQLVQSRLTKRLIVENFRANMPIFSLAMKHSLDRDNCKYIFSKCKVWSCVSKSVSECFFFLDQTLEKVDSHHCARIWMYSTHGLVEFPSPPQHPLYSWAGINASHSKNTRSANIGVTLPAPPLPPPSKKKNGKADDYNNPELVIKEPSP